MTNRPKGTLLVLLAIGVAIGLVTATGAFTSVTAERTVSIETAGDGSALLQLVGNSSSGGDVYVTGGGSTSPIQVDFSQSNLNNAQGVNVNATTNVTHMINVTNNGQSDVNFYVTLGSTPNQVDLHFYHGADTSDSVMNSGNAIPISAGSTASIGISIDLGPGVTDFNATATFVAERQ